MSLPSSMRFLMCSANASISSSTFPILYPSFPTG
nr:MAG TPA: hypothetical protein [Caudoviricetes sp.]